MFVNLFDDDDDDSSSGSDSGSMGGVTLDRIVTCPDTRCQRVLRDHQLITHFRNRHRTWEYPLSSDANSPSELDTFYIRVCYRRRAEANPASLFFSNSPHRHSWMSGIIYFQRQKFMLHTTEENNEMKHWVTILSPTGGTKRSYIAHVVVANPDGTIPEVERLVQWRGAVREFNGDGRDHGHSKFVIPNHRLWKEFAYVNEPRLPRDPPDSHPPHVLWNLRLLLVNAPLLHAGLRLLDNGEMVRGLAFRDLWNNRIHPCRCKLYQWIRVEWAIQRTVRRLAMNLPDEDQGPPTSPELPVTLSPLLIDLDDDLFVLRLDEDSPLTHFDAMLLLKVDGRQELDEEELMELQDAWKIWTLWPQKFEEIQLGRERVPGPSTRPDPVVGEDDDIFEGFFALRLDEPEVPDPLEGRILEKVRRREGLNFEEFVELKTMLELFRFWEKYVLGLLPLPLDL